MQLQITIKGQGTASEIIKALENVIKDIQANKETWLYDGVEWGDAILITEIKEATEVF